MASQFIGARISLISKSDIRYVGTLHSISQEDSTIALENVRSYGTEDRRVVPEKIDPSPSTFEYILFRASDVKDLHVEEHKQRVSDVPNDPAIISSTKTRAPPIQSGGSTNSHTYASKQQTPGSQVKQTEQTALELGPGFSQDFTPHHPLSRGVANGDVGNNSDAQNNSRRGDLPGMGVHLLHDRRGRGGRRFDNQAHNAPRPPMPGPDFDFELSNAKFDKGQFGKEVGVSAQDDGGDIEIGHEGVEPTPAAKPEVYYNKSSFFDNISCETKGRQQMEEERRNRMPGDRRAKQLEERRINVETFGQTTVDGARHRRNFRGQGGYRGGFRGAAGGVQPGVGGASGFYGNGKGRGGW